MLFSKLIFGFAKLILGLSEISEVLSEAPDTGYIGGTYRIIKPYVPGGEGERLDFPRQGQPVLTAVRALPPPRDAIQAPLGPSVTRAA